MERHDFSREIKGCLLSLGSVGVAGKDEDDSSFERCDALGVGIAATWPKKETVPLRTPAGADDEQNQNDDDASLTSSLLSLVRPFCT